MLTFKLALRNTFRNKRRTILCCLAIAFGLACMILTEAWMSGMLRSMITMSTSSWTGQAQIHNLDFIDTEDVNKLILDDDHIISELISHPEITAFAPRLRSFGMIASARNTSAVGLFGVDPIKESQVTRLGKAVPGDLKKILQPGQILIGVKLADLLEVTTGDRVVLTTSQASTGEMAQEMFRVGAIFNFNSRFLDNGLALIHLTDARRLLNIPRGFHEIAIGFSDPDAGVRQRQNFETIAGSGNRFRDYTKLMPALTAMTEMSGLGLVIIGVILFAIIAIGIINTMFMAIHERSFEFGVQRAIGTRPGQIFSMVLQEAGIMGLLALPPGIALAWLSSWIMATYGVDFSGTDFGGVAMNEPIKAIITLAPYLYMSLAALLLTVIAAIYPAIHAARMNIARALHKSL